jgi:imidazoleglycerol-phosphate dehydratase
MHRERRRVALRRRTRGTEVEVELRLDGSGRTLIETPFGLLNDLLHLLAANSGLDLRLVQTANRHADDPYAIDDLGSALAEAFRRAVGLRPRIRQFGSSIVPVGDALVLAAVDLVSPPVFQFGASFQGRQVGDMDLALVERFLATFADRLGASLHVRVLAGENEENRLKGIFVALGRCLSQAALEMEREGAREVAADLDYSEGLRPAPSGAPALDEAVIEELESAFEAEPEVEPALVPDRPVERRPRLPRGEDRDRSRRRREPRVEFRAPAGEPEPVGAEEELPVLPDFPDGSDYGEFEPEEPLVRTADAEANGGEEDAEGDRGNRRRRRGRRGGRGRRRGPGGIEAELGPETAPATEEQPMPRGERPEGPERSDRPDRGERSDRLPRPDRAERPLRSERTGRDDYRSPRRPAEEEAFTEAAPARREAGDAGGWRENAASGYSRRSETEDPELEPAESAPRPRSSRYGRGRRPDEQPDRPAEDAPPSSEDRSEAEVSEGRGRHRAVERGVEREPTGSSGGDVLDFITKPAPGEAPAPESTRAQARVRRRRR